MECVSRTRQFLLSLFRSFILLEVRFLFEQRASCLVSCAEVILLYVALMLQLLRHYVKLGAFDFFRQLFCSMSSGFEQLIVQGSLRLIARLLILHIPIAKLLDQVLTISQILLLIRLSLSFIVDNLSSLGLGHLLLPTLSLVLHRRFTSLISQVPTLHLLTIYHLL